MKQYLINILLSIDQFFNTLLGGDPDETLSSRAGKREGRKIIPTIVCWILDKLDPGHCKDAIEEDEGKREVF
jgi:hypothetical protein